VALFRKSSTDSASSAATDSTSDESGKGRATPSRKQAEAERRERLKATARGESTSRGRSSVSSATTREARNEARKRMLAGDERALSARDRGPERRFARDYVDSRHTVGEYFLYLAILVLVLGLVPALIFKILSEVLLVLIVIGLAVDSFRIYRGAGSALEAKFPTSDLKGVARYAVMRGMVTRRMRAPKPQVARGAAK
jgi:Flp pilus assembly protein TadB